MNHDVICVIPRWGRTFSRIMKKFASFADKAQTRDEILHVIAAVADSKKTASPDLKTMAEVWRRVNLPYLNLAPDRKRQERAYRLGFLGMDINIAGIGLRIEGDEPHNGSSLIKLDEADFTIVGLDELLAMHQHYIKEPSLVTKWGNYNYNIDRSTELRIAGSANLDSYNKAVNKNITDFVGFFLISSRSFELFRPDIKKLTQYGTPVFVKGRYKEFMRRLYPGINAVSVENVEDAVLRQEGGIGIEIVQTGSTVREKKLKVFGKPLFLSESLYVADYQRYLTNPKLRELLQIFSPGGYFDKTRIEHYIDWFKALEINLKEAWVNKPAPEQIFCSVEEMKNGLRPYRLKTRRWMASDNYKAEEAEDLVAESLKYINTIYH